MSHYRHQEYKAAHRKETPYSSSFDCFGNDSSNNVVRVFPFVSSVITADTARINTHNEGPSCFCEDNTRGRLYEKMRSTSYSAKSRTHVRVMSIKTVSESQASTIGMRTWRSAVLKNDGQGLVWLFLVKETHRTTKRKPWTEQITPRINCAVAIAVRDQKMV